jgi:hypothetical protein
MCESALLWQWLVAGGLLAGGWWQCLVAGVLLLER